MAGKQAMPFLSSSSSSSPLLLLPPPLHLCTAAATSHCKGAATQRQTSRGTGKESLAIFSTHYLPTPVPPHTYTRTHTHKMSRRLLKHGAEAFKPHFVDGRWQRPLISKRVVRLLSFPARSFSLPPSLGRDLPALRSILEHPSLSLPSLPFL